MNRPRFTSIHLAAAVLAAVAATVGVVALTACLLLGKWGLSVLESVVLINTQFVGEYDGDAAADSAIAAMVDALGDRWSYSLTAEQYEAQNQRRANSFVGIGVTVSYEREEGLTIVSVEEGGPAAGAGLQPGEVITAVDGQSIAGDARETAVDLIQGEEGTQVTVTVLAEDGTSREVTMTRARIAQKSVTWEMLEGDVALITVENFYTGCAQQGREALAEAAEAGARAVVFDMRNNPGGYITELTSLLDAVLPEGVIFRTSGKFGPEQKVESDSECVELPMAVLVNEDTYSAAEFFAAELQEQGWAVIVGTPTSGKGYSQITCPLPYGGALALSTHTYRTGEGTSLIGTGLTLDVEVELTEEQAALLAAGVLPRGEDAQLQAALAALAVK